ncbi:putative glycosyl hydrolase protein [Phaeoacremonium minimum UCRPA7]|uniref:Putative glycosyl hydrolase protein n=1 Tax=Phaeoacremonium minimum (strain UCR-PA7) TaxID=1286976 RepID=R8BDP1_PHAM7|nr:putative glycosyl hydrolase protein [Phaeoacremonium minimum UCRPA7]EON97419.1 putative glycosyl hydrolase protein [Phaeoacremonium minimum UCRPA7]
MLHESGTGGAPKYGVVSQLPALGDVANPLAYPGEPRASADITKIGYYKSSLASGITVELGASERAGFYRHSFPQIGESANVIVDVSHVLPSFRGMGLEQHYLGGGISVSDDSVGLSYEGWGKYDNGWNRAPGWTVYFCGVGVSFISTKQACQNVNSQIPSGTSLASLTDNARDAWNDQVLSKVTTTDTDTSKLQLLYSSLYFMQLLPQNKTGENPLWTSSEPYYDDTFTLWDLDPLSCGGCYWADYYYQGLPWEYSFNAHHDIDTLISLSGGEETFAARLETIFTPGLNPSGAFDKMIFNPGNEPSFTSPFLFNFVDRQDLTVNHSRAIAKAYYSATPGGLPGNSDAGAMQSWVLWVMIGLYPMTGQTTFLIGSPWFDDLSISLGGGNSLHITSTGGSDTSFYVQSLKVNGKTWTKNWVEWSDVFENGGTMDFVLGPEPVDWATGPAPPSPGTENNGSRTRKSSGSEDGSGASASGI